MHAVDGVITLSPTDLVGFLACEHLTQLELAAARGRIERPAREDAELDLLARLGEAHERAQLERLRDEGRTVVVIPDGEESLEGLRVAEAQTLQAMRDGAGVVYQAAFFDGLWRGRADFLLRVESPSALGDWSYEVADAKLARSAKVAALLQMCEYSLHVARLQGRAPDEMHVILGDGTRDTQQVAEYDAYHRAARRRFEDAVRATLPVATYPDPVEHCRVCRWRDVCIAQRRRDDHLSLVAGMRRDHTRRLQAVGIDTVAALAAAPAEPQPDIGDSSWRRLRRQARLQVDERVTGAQRWELLPQTLPGLGLAALPPPSRGDLFFDIEGDPFVNGDGLEYLFGISEVVEGNPRFHAFWAHDRPAEKRAFESVVDLIVDGLTRDPELHVYHYASYEASALKRLMGRHATREEEVDRLLRGGVLVDLYQVVRQGVCVSKESYGLKALEAFYMPKREETIADAASSIVAYERWLETGDQALLDDIRRYNERDCDSTRLLRDWLEARRDELAAELGVPVPRPERRNADAPESVAEATADTRDLAERLTLGVADDLAARTSEQQARWLLAQLLEWHRREAKSGWWEYFARRAMTDDELVEDSEAIGAITHLGEVGPVKKSVVHRYRFDPGQEHKLDPDDAPHDPRTGASAGVIVRLDNDRGIVELRRGPSLVDAPHPTSLIPASPISTTPMRLALRRVALDVIDDGLAGPGRYRSVRDLLTAAPPRVDGRAAGAALVRDGEDAVEATCRLVEALDGSTLAVQGPPGCGKTYTGAQVVVHLVGLGRHVGVCATTHRAIANLLNEISKVAAQRETSVRILQKCEVDQRCTATGVRHTSSNDDVVDALLAGDVDVVAGTSWLFSDERLDGLLDVLIVDEAGQMSLANACAVGTSARSLVLLGDPQQLAQPSQGIHPVGADRSALEHILGDADTIAPDRGVFLPVTRRMHPRVCDFVSTAFYDGRLTSHPRTILQSVHGDALLDGAGIRFVPVEHRGNRTYSPEEVDAVRRTVERAWLATWTDSDGAEHAMTLEDVLVVAPYNAQVKRLRDAIKGLRAGTVDRFQGQQAAVAIYAMATSSAEDMPRNTEFLFSRNRLNVAVSRARALAIVICSPQLLATRCRTPEQVRLVNALCRYAEMSQLEEPAAARR